MNPAMESVIEEREQQDLRWGGNRRLPAAVWHAILSEEVGVAAREVLAVRDHQGSEHLRAALVQVAATAVAWIEALDDRRTQ